MQQQLALRLSELKLHQVLRPLHQVVDLVLSWILNNQSVVHVQVVVEPKHVHPRVVNHVRLVRVVVELLVVLVFSVVFILQTTIIKRLFLSRVAVLRLRVVSNFVNCYFVHQLGLFLINNCL